MGRENRRRPFPLAKEKGDTQIPGEIGQLRPDLGRACVRAAAENRLALAKRPVPARGELLLQPARVQVFPQELDRVTKVEK